MPGLKKLQDMPAKRMGGTSGLSPRLGEPAVNQRESEMLRPLLDQMQKINQTLSNMESVLSNQQKQMTDTSTKMEEIAKKYLVSAEDKQKIKKKVNKMEKHQEAQDNKLLMLQMEKSNLTLQFQGIKEVEKEDRSILANALAPLNGSEAGKLS